MIIRGVEAGGITLGDVALPPAAKLVQSKIVGTTYAPDNFITLAAADKSLDGMLLSTFIDATSADPNCASANSAPLLPCPRATERDELSLARAGTYVSFARDYLIPPTPSTTPSTCSFLQGYYRHKLLPRLHACGLLLV